MNAESPIDPTAMRLFRRHQHLAREGETPRQIWLIEEGWACRYRLLSGARRQITALFLPGEYCEPQWLLGGPASQGVVALTPLRARGLALPAPGEEPAPARRDQTRALLAAALRTLDRQSDWIAALGRKTACERLCTLLADLFERLGQSGRVCRDRCLLPLTQADFADIAGLTPVHVNRVLRSLREAGLIVREGQWLRIPDGEALRLAAGGLARMETRAAA